MSRRRTPPPPVAIASRYCILLPPPGASFCLRLVLLGLFSLRPSQAVDVSHVRLLVEAANTTDHASSAPPPLSYDPCTDFPNLVPALAFVGLSECHQVIPFIAQFGGTDVANVCATSQSVAADQLASLGLPLVLTGADWEWVVDSCPETCSAVGVHAIPCDGLPDPPPLPWSPPPLPPLPPQTLQWEKRTRASILNIEIVA